MTMSYRRHHHSPPLLLLFLLLSIPYAAAFSSPSPKADSSSSKSTTSTTLSPSTVTSKLANVLQNNNPFQRKEKEEEVPEPTFLESLGLESNVEPKRFYVSSDQFLDIVGASFPALFRLGTGIFAEGYKLSLTPQDSSKYTIFSIGKYQLSETCSPSLLERRRRNIQPIILYDMEACPFCRKVRECVSILSLDVTFCPCPKNGIKSRQKIKDKYGDDTTFPVMIDPNTGIELFDSDDILTYLFKTYGDGVVPWTLTIGNALVPLTAALGLLPRFNCGLNAKYSNAPSQPLTLYSYEGSPFCKLVRETLTELEIGHTQISCPRGSSNRQALLDRTGRFQVPYLEDPNTGVELFESQAICEYLRKVYGVLDTPVKYM
uniref:GST N-terminal domain-containing protein n=1 Tax=Helicotheca tamesis TaxID=374047 RepID=A0A7S2N1J2_9STRA|eukprot:CAMPEP_0185741322 /NCGR_PEP_ID=MMETSP1171-20130828/38899_1 /TAXON_ID=374046 /ORGANISM="Helicotheca tamensis, Strain CCMP826" /LENGTH=374 /DNA_ID=CAMNT_0028413285 /DNA_START=51 /DNA_END=1175 /DNA_ORIENTATION=+